MISARDLLLSGDGAGKFRFCAVQLELPSSGHLGERLAFLDRLLLFDFFREKFYKRFVTCTTLGCNKEHQTGSFTKKKKNRNKEHKKGDGVVRNESVHGLEVGWLCHSCLNFHHSRSHEAKCEVVTSDPVYQCILGYKYDLHDITYYSTIQHVTLRNKLRVIFLTSESLFKKVIFDDSCPVCGG